MRNRERFSFDLAHVDDDTARDVFKTWLLGDAQFQAAAAGREPPRVFTLIDSRVVLKRPSQRTPNQH